MEYQTWRLDEWVDMLAGIYGPKNEQKLDGDIWHHVIKKAGRLSEDFRKERIDPEFDEKVKLTGMLINIPDVFAWFSALSARYGSLEEMVWHKFPSVCPYCLQSECKGERLSIEPERREYRLHLYRENMISHPQTLHDWQNMFTRIYHRVNKRQSIHWIGTRLMEEIAEVSGAIYDKDVTVLREELADVFAWTVGALVRCEIHRGEIYRLDDILWTRYPDQCPHCESNPCLDSCKG